MLRKLADLSGQKGNELMLGQLFKVTLKFIDQWIDLIWDKARTHFYKFVRNGKCIKIAWGLRRSLKLFFSEQNIGRNPGANRNALKYIKKYYDEAVEDVFRGIMNCGRNRREIEQCKDHAEMATDCVCDIVWNVPISPDGFCSGLTKSDQNLTKTIYSYMAAEWTGYQDLSKLIWETVSNVTTVAKSFPIYEETLRGLLADLLMSYSSEYSFSPPQELLSSIIESKETLLSISNLIRKIQGIKPSFGVSSMSSPKFQEFNWIRF